MARNTASKKLGTQQRTELLQILEARFESNMTRHEGFSWKKVRDRLEADPAKLWVLNEMERTGGEPDIIGYHKRTREFVFVDCSAQSPSGRRSVCYDDAALEARKKNKPDDSALAMAAEMGIDILTEAQYRELQGLGDFDTTTSSWLLTPPDIRERGGAIFGDFRYNTVFIYHNGAESYYAARGFRGSLRV